MGFPYDAVRRTVSDLIFAIHMRDDPRPPAGQAVPRVPVAEWVVDALVFAALRGALRGWVGSCCWADSGIERGCAARGASVNC
jgi:hypothetical protein